MGLVLVGWYRSNISTISNSVITQADITKQQAMQIPHPNAAGIIISISTTGFPSLGPKGQISDGMTNTFYVFRTTENTVISNFETINTSSQGTKPKNGKIWKGKGKELPKTILRESKQVYNGQVLDCENRIGQKVFVDSQYESFLMNFLRKSVVQIDRSVDQDFRSLSFAKYHAKMLIKKEMKKNNPSEFDIIKWLNMKSSLVSQDIINQDTTINCSTTLNDVNGDVGNDGVDNNNDDGNDLMSIDTNGPDTLLGYKLSGHFKEFGITKNEFDLMNEKSETNNESSTNNLAPTTTSVVKESSLSSSSSSTSTAAAIEKRVIRKTIPRRFTQINGLLTNI
ncbi:3573_t:CDS:2 [Entrophospora sp. SA101]|nr:11985_t:CDS:2 [Entrophospora sp. SA101]CAJ0912957.1 3573_t:CDS:2 [Entrophospora sp. SA101]